MKINAEQLKVGAIFKMEGNPNEYMRVPNFKNEGIDMIVACERITGNIVPIQKTIHVLIDASELKNTTMS